MQFVLIYVLQLLITSRLLQMNIYASPASMVGSIGVLYSGFGFVDVMNKVGVTRQIANCRMLIKDF